MRGRLGSSVKKDDEHTDQSLSDWSVENTRQARW